MTEEISLIFTAVTIGVVHTITGPDHYVPFVAMAHANDWSTRKSIAVTVACGLAHVMSSVVIGTVGLIVGLLVLSLQRIEALEALRGETAAWMLIAFGLGYLLFGLLIASGQVAHRHGTCDNRQTGDLDDDSESTSSKPGWTPWLLFLVFAFGPCEALIPMLMYPAAQANWMAVLAVVLAFGAATLATMIFAVLVMQLGLRSLRLPDLHRYSHALAGGAILACGLAVKFGL